MFFRFSKNYALWDTIFIIAIAGYTLFGLWGVSLLSCDGLKISSDLCCYVQNMAGELRRELFSLDPLLAVPTTANSIISLESTLASLLQPGDDIVQGRCCGLALWGCFSTTLPVIISDAAFLTRR